MPPQFTPPAPTEMALLRTFHHLKYPGQQPILARFAAGEIGVETTAYLLIQEAKERFPAKKAAIEADAYDRATRAREQREMAENEKAAGPTFVDYTPEGRPVNDPMPLPPGLLVAQVTAPDVAVGSTAPTKVAPPAAAETLPVDEPDTTAEESTDDALKGDDDWLDQGPQEDPQEYVGDD